jgi:hypothetical protein
MGLFWLIPVLDSETMNNYLRQNTGLRRNNDGKGC